MIINIETFAGINFSIAVTETLYFLHPVLSCRLWIFWYFFSEIYVSLINRHYLLNLKGHLKIIKNYNHYCSWYQCYYKWHFYHYFHIVHYLWINWITWTYSHCIFPFPFDSKSSYRKTKIIPIDLSPPKTQTHARNCFQLYEIFIYCKW